MPLPTLRTNCFIVMLAPDLTLPSTDKLAESELTQRERQCLAWTAHGKIVADIAALVQIAPRTVVFHLENARPKFSAASIAQCVGEALRRGLLS
ncbi:response regulator transcription factor [Bradyrhizobium sp. TZ2]